jgi:hypothetical protein
VLDHFRPRPHLIGRAGAVTASEEAATTAGETVLTGAVEYRITSSAAGRREVAVEPGR